MSGALGSLAEGWRTLILFLLCLAALLVGYAGPLGFVPIVGAAGVLLAPTMRLSRAAVWIAGPLLLLAIWAAVSQAWSPAAPDWSALDDYADWEGVTALKLFIMLALSAALVLATGALSSKGARLCLAMLGFTVVMLTVAAFAEALTGAGFYQAMRVALDDPIRPDLAAKNVAQATYVVAALFWPAALGLLKFEPRAALLVGAVAVFNVMAALMFGAFAPALAVLAGLATYALVAAFPRVGALLCAAGAAGFTLIAPFVFSLVTVPPGLPASWTARGQIWTFAADRVLERPWMGWGLDASRSFGPAVPLHTPDAALQLWLELGLVGAVLGAAAWIVIFWFAGRAAEDDPPTGGAWAAAATSYFVIGALSFGVWQEWWLALGAMAFVGATLLRRAFPSAADRPAGLTAL